ncbi:heterokaryon incompatibility protein-domain-containing protein [Xylariomycetidae sp. FL0641]|nr:heterokaryon incompatibility protein-domain-containing protein [Xylariomycetidae sp. FL0641]
MSSSEINYEPLLDCLNLYTFRLLRIHQSAREDDVLECELGNFTIHQSPPFRAVSYTWGDPFAKGERNGANELAPIVIDGQETLMSGTLASVLKAMRDWHPTRTNWVWVDALCIDQTNLEERGMQVSLMNRIYRRADLVFVWLGPSAQGSDHAFSLVDELARDSRAPDARRRILERATNPKDQRRWQALADLMDRRWFRRAWILQECVLSEQLEFACGRAVLDGKAFLRGFDSIDLFSDQIYPILQDSQGVTLNAQAGEALRCMSLMLAARLNGTVYPMAACQSFTRTAEATDPRDYIYAKLGLASDGQHVQPDYSKSLEETYRNFVLGHIKAFRSLDIITYDARPRQNQGLPSWVPDWSQSFGAHPLVKQQGVPVKQVAESIRKNLVEDASTPEIATFDITDGKLGRLRVKGCLLDTVDGVGATGELGRKTVEPSRPMSQSTSDHSAYEDDVATFNALWRSLVANKNATGSEVQNKFGSILAAITSDDMLQNPQLGPRFRAYYENTKDLRVAGRTVEEWMEWRREVEPIPTFTEEEQLEVGRAFVDVLYFRRTFTTSDGFVGAGPAGMNPGDFIGVLQGSQLPVVLRKVQSGDYELVGAAYSHQAMVEAQTREIGDISIV